MIINCVNRNVVEPIVNEPKFDFINHLNKYKMNY